MRPHRLSEAPARSVLLSVRGLTLTTVEPDGGPSQPLVTGVDLEVRAGEFVGLVGRSGSGKTLTSRAICGVLPRTVQQVDGQLRCQHVDGRLARPHLLLQNAPTALDPFTTLRHALTRALTRAAGPSGPATTVEACLERVGLRPAARYADRYPIELSGGEAHRAAVALACADDAPLIVADEPSTGLDPALCIEIADRLAALTDTGRAVLLITHDIALFADRVDRLYVMHAGRIEAIVHPGSPCWRGIPAAGPARALFEAAFALERPHRPGSRAP